MKFKLNKGNKVQFSFGFALLVGMYMGETCKEKGTGLTLYKVGIMNDFVWLVASQFEAISQEKFPNGADKWINLKWIKNLK